MCEYPEAFYHNVEKEFLADDIFETKARIKTRLQNLVIGGNKTRAANAKEGVEMKKVNAVEAGNAAPSDVPLIAATSDETIVKNEIAE